MSDTTTPEVRWDAPDDGVWSREAAHYLGVVPVPMRDTFESAFADGFRAGLEPLGAPLSHLAARHVNGWPYVSVFLHDVPRKAGGPPPLVILKIITRLHPGFRRRTKLAAQALAQRRPQRMAATWLDERDRWIERNVAMQRTDLSALSGPELRDHLHALETLLGDGIRRHFELIPTCIPLGHWFVRSAEWGLPAADARRAVMHSTPVHDEAHSRLSRIATALGSAVPTTLEEIRSHSPEAAAALDDYLLHHGCWAAEDAVLTPTIDQHPGSICQAITATRGNATTAPEAPDAVLARLRDRVPGHDRAEFDTLAADAHQAYIVLDDNSGITSNWTLGLASRGLRHAADRLVAEGAMTAPDDIWALTVDEIGALLDGTTTLSATDVSARGDAWRALGQLDPPDHLNGEPSPPPDPTVFPAPVAHLMTAIGAFLNDKFNDAHEASGIGQRAVTGRAVVARSASEAIERLEPGDILVTTATTPAFNSILPIVGGLVVSEGGPSCHAAVVARELDLSALVGVGDTIATIPDGAVIELDPVAATVTVVD